MPRALSIVSMTLEHMFTVQLYVLASSQDTIAASYARQVMSRSLDAASTYGCIIVCSGPGAERLLCQGTCALCRAALRSDIAERRVPHTGPPALHFAGMPRAYIANLRAKRRQSRSHARLAAQQQWALARGMLQACLRLREHSLASLARLLSAHQ